jgi:hypothetical protein
VAQNTGQLKAVSLSDEKNKLIKETLASPLAAKFLPAQHLLAN